MSWSGNGTLISSFGFRNYPMWNEERSAHGMEAPLTFATHVQYVPKDYSVPCIVFLIQSRSGERAAPNYHVRRSTAVIGTVSRRLKDGNSGHVCKVFPAHD